MNISGEDVAAAVGVMALLGGVFKGYRAFIQMREHIKTLFNKVEEIKAEKDHDIQELKDLFQSVRTEISELKTAQQEQSENLVKSIHEMHIRLMEKISESRTHGN
jgi:prefoldin subunit 5